jgi:hypothetical protein
VLAGTGAVLREHAQAIRESIARDGFYLRVPAGKPFYLYLTQTLDRSQARRSPSLAHTPLPPAHEIPPPRAPRWIGRVPVRARSVGSSGTGESAGG